MFEIARMDFTQYRKHFFPKQQDGWDILSCCFASPLPPQCCPARLFIDDNCRPRSAAVVMGDFVFLSGEPKLSFLRRLPVGTACCSSPEMRVGRNSCPHLPGRVLQIINVTRATGFPLRRRKISCSKFSPPCRKE